MLDRFRVVLVRPAFAGNIGSVARVMRNFGVDDLRLVQPHADHFSEEARRLATHGESLLDIAKSVPHLSDAVADCGLVVAASARHGGLFRQQNLFTPRELMPRLADASAATDVALVFGPEQTGLTDAEVTRCHYLATIPADAEHPALNLAQAVAVCLYELFLASLATPPPARPTLVADFASQERMYETLRQALTEIHFLYGDKADSLMHALRHLIGRAQPSPMEVDVLLGLARQIQWFAAKETRRQGDRETGRQEG